jgi:hypothetical protein
MSDARGRGDYPTALGHLAAAEAIEQAAKQRDTSSPIADRLAALEQRYRDLD